MFFRRKIWIASSKINRSALVMNALPIIQTYLKLPDSLAPLKAGY